MNMISQRCPKCNSSRIRRGYRPTPIWSKVIFRYNLLCDNCNWEFKGFAVPGTVTNKPQKTRKKQKNVEKSEEGKELDKNENTSLVNEIDAFLQIDEPLIIKEEQKTEIFEETQQLLENKARTPGKKKKRNRDKTAKA